MGTMTAITVKTTAAATTTSQDKKEEDENNLKQQQRQQNFVLNLCLVAYFCFGIALHAPFVFTSEFQQTLDLSHVQVGWIGTSELVVKTVVNLFAPKINSLYENAASRKNEYSFSSLQHTFRAWRLTSFLLLVGFCGTLLLSIGFGVLSSYSCIILGRCFQGVGCGYMLYRIGLISSYNAKSKDAFRSYKLNATTFQNVAAIITRYLVVLLGAKNGLFVVTAVYALGSVILSLAQYKTTIQNLRENGENNTDNNINKNTDGNQDQGNQAGDIKTEEQLKDGNGNQKKQQQQNDEKTKANNPKKSFFSRTLRGYPQTYWLLVVQYMLVTTFTQAYVYFSPYLLETLYELDSVRSNQIVGIIVVIALVFTIPSGKIVKKYPFLEKWLSVILPLWVVAAFVPTIFVDGTAATATTTATTTTMGLLWFEYTSIGFVRSLSKPVTSSLIVPALRSSSPTLNSRKFETGMTYGIVSGLLWSAVMYQLYFVILSHTEDNHRYTLSLFNTILAIISVIVGAMLSNKLPFE